MMIFEHRKVVIIILNVFDPSTVLRYPNNNMFAIQTGVLLGSFVHFTTKHSFLVHDIHMISHTPIHCYINIVDDHFSHV